MATAVYLNSAPFSIAEHNGANVSAESTCVTERHMTGIALDRIASAQSLGVFGDEHLESLRIVLNHISEAVFVLNEHGQFKMINPFGEQLLGANRKAIVGKFWTDYLAVPYTEEYTTLLQQWAQSPRNDAMFNHGPREVLVQRPDGSLVEVDLSLSCIPGDRRVYIGVMHDVTAHKKEHHELRRLARTDYLTQLANRRAFDEVLQRNWEDSKANELPLSVIMIDIDHFKKYNDEFGHLQGDFCLRQIAGAIQNNLDSPRMLAARYGGEEFAVVLPNCDQRQAATIAENIRQRVNALSFTHGGFSPPVHLSVSVGVACSYQKATSSIHALLGAADTALYRAKLSGRNRVVLTGTH